MEEHKRFKRPKSHTASLDGIVSDGRQLGMPVSRSYTPNRGESTPSIDNFIHRGEGFNPMRQAPRLLGQSPEGAEAAALFEQPIILDDAEPSSRKKATRRSKKAGRSVAARLTKILIALILLGGIYF